MRKRTVLLVVLLGVLSVGVGFGQEVKVVKGDYQVQVTADGVEASYKGITFICASHLSIAKPEWKGSFYGGRNLPASASADIKTARDRIVITDTVPEIDGSLTQEIRITDTGLVMTLALQVGKDIGPSPCEFAAAVFPAELFAGHGYRGAGLLGAESWRTLPAAKPKETGPGTKVVLSSVLGLELAGERLFVEIESIEGPTPTFYDMRSRSYPDAEKNFWLLYSWRAGQGEMRIEMRIAAKPAVKAEKAAGAALAILDGRARHEVRAIAVDNEVHAVEKAAARELQQYLRQMSGREIPIVQPNKFGRRDKGIIHVASVGSARRHRLVGLRHTRDLESSAYGYDSYVVQSRRGNVVIAGSNPRATVYGVYRLLERLGCKFYAREHEVVPHVEEIPGRFVITDGAAFEWRAMSGRIAPMKCTLSPGEWTAEVAGVNLPKMMGSPKGGFWHHTMPFLLPAKELAKTHPEYIALINGQRRVVDRPAFQQHCLSNPGLQRMMIDAVLQWIADDPDPMYYPVHYGDVAKFCECDECKALYKDKGSISDMAIWFDNLVAEEVAAKYPDKFVTILAYLSTREPPLTAKPDAKLLIIFCAIRECQARPWSAPVNMALDVCKDLEEWIAGHPLGGKGFITFEYPTTYRYSGLPYPALYAFADNVRYYDKLDLRGVYICGLGRWKHLEHLYSYIIPRILWDPDQDLAALVDEFSKGWYGPAWKPMRDYIELLHGTAMASTCKGVMDCHAGPGQRFFKELFTPEFAAKAHALFDKAEALAPDQFVKRRILKEKWGLLFLDLYHNGQRPGDLDPAPTALGVRRKAGTVEDYRKVAELLRINRMFNRPWEIEKNAWMTYSLSSIVGIEPTRQPWWSCPKIKALMGDPDGAYKAQTDMVAQLTRHFVTIENEHVKTMVVPHAGGRIWRFYDKHSKQDIFRRGSIPVSVFDGRLNTATHVDMGGYEEYAGERFADPGWSQVYETTSTQSNGRISMAVTLPDGLKLTRTVRVIPGGRGIEVESVLENSSGKARNGVMLRVHPEFSYQGGRDVELSVKTEAGDFKVVPFKSDTFLSGGKLPAGAWRVRFPKSGIAVVNEFDPAEVGTCYLYAGGSYFNLELFSVKRNLPPGGKLRLRHRYVVSGS